ncbi:alpha/beta hydrolase [Prescottella defluvii]|uniref:alpha/beta hydrolase n=1 Tax=Prescottella defluvii TaxID=1323361 RepID=UPI000A3E0CBF|nr:alpha/beta hydrolase [Prescottella defluvii]
MANPAKMWSSVFAAAAVALVVSGCSTAPDESESARQAAAFPEIYAQTIEWSACGDDFGLGDARAERLAARGAPVDTYRCATVAAPLDWNDTGNRETIELAAVHIPSTGDGEPIGTLLSNPGGPGESGLALATALPTVERFGSILDRYDLLGFDPRGIGRSTPVDCDEVSDIRELNLAMCAVDQPIALSMGTSQVARDMDLLRSLMGDDSMHYLGYSYGTMLGATYSTLFPERVGRMLLDSASASDWASPVGDFNQSAAIARETSALLEGCGSLYQATACPIGGQSALVEAVARFDDQPMIASDGTEVTGQTLYAYLTTALYQRAAGRELVLESVGAAISGDQEQVDTIAEEMTGGGAAVRFDGNIVRCHSFPNDPGLPQLVEHIEQVGLPEVMGGPEINDDTLRDFVDLSCAALPNSGDDITDSFSGSPDAPILVIGITGDHATPYEGAQELVRQLGNARLLTLEGVGHTVSFSNRSSCADDIATAYLLDGELPPENTVCTDD